MRRREFLALAGAIAAAPRGVFAQTAKVPHVVLLNNGYTDDMRAAMFQGLADYGYTDGKNIAVEFVNAPTIADVPAYAAMAVAKKPDLIWTFSSAPPLALKALTTTIPVVFTVIQDPVAIGVVSSYAHPDANLTGDMVGGTDFIGKQIDLIHEVLPNLKRLAVMGLPADPPYPIMLSSTQAAAHSIGVETSSFDIHEGVDVTPLFDQIVAFGAEAVQIIPANYVFGIDSQLADLALRHKLPSFMFAQDAANGIMVGFSSNISDVIRRSASYVDAILKGAKPSDLPIDQPSMFDLVLNQKTAAALGITFPQSVLYQATQIIS